MLMPASSVDLVHFLTYFDTKLQTQEDPGICLL